MTNKYEAQIYKQEKYGKQGNYQFVRIAEFKKLIF